MKGWVYVFSNKAMPNLVKIGYSKSDPELRAKEIDGTGIPHPFIVQYEILIDEPHEIEKRIHKHLNNKRENENREFFRCSPVVAIVAVRYIAGSNILLENYKAADRAEVERIEREYLITVGQENSASVGSATAEQIAKKPKAISSTSKKTNRKQSRKNASTSTFNDTCKYCGIYFTVTLTSYDSGATCPNCFKLNVRL